METDARAAPTPPEQAADPAAPPELQKQIKDAAKHARATQQEVQKQQAAHNAAVKRVADIQHQLTTAHAAEFQAKHKVETAQAEAKVAQDIYQMLQNIQAEVLGEIAKKEAGLLTQQTQDLDARLAEKKTAT